MGLPDGDLLAGLYLPVLRKGSIELLVELPRRVVGDIQQRDLFCQDSKSRPRDQGANRQETNDSLHGHLGLLQLAASSLPIMILTFNPVILWIE